MFATTVLPLAPAFFFFLAVAARSVFVRLRAFLLGKQRSGFFLSFDVPQGPLLAFLSFGEASLHVLVSLLRDCRLGFRATTSRLLALIYVFVQAHDYLIWDEPK